MNQPYIVGIHNKPGYTPLQSGTKTGNIVNLMEMYAGIRFIRTNFIDLDYLPSHICLKNFQFDWYAKYNPPVQSRIILLGKLVQENFYINEHFWRYIKVNHPSSLYGKSSIISYLDNFISLL